MRDFGILRTVQNALVQRSGALHSVVPRSGPRTILESFAGAWQQNVEVQTTDVLAFPTVYRCIGLIASDIAKLRVKLVQRDADGIWSETTNPAYSPVLRKPNLYQTRIQFFECWMISKLIRGNTYVLKQRDGRGVVTRLHVLDPDRVEPLISKAGNLFYRLKTDELVGLPDEVIVPGREIIHDRMNPLYHPLVGVSPIYAAGLAAVQGRRIQEESATFFANGAKPGGVLTSDSDIDDADAKQIKADWKTMFSGKNAGNVAVLADGLKYQEIQITAHDSQLIEQLKWSSETVCSVFGVPSYKVGVGTPPSHDNVEAMDTQYYAQCLQTHFEHIELLLDEGLAMPEGLGTEFDLDDLLRLDSKSQMEVLDKSKGKMTVNEQRKRLGLKPVEGGDTVYLQEQDHSLAALAKRDAREDPFAKGAAPAPEPANDNTDDEAEGQAKAALETIAKGFNLMSDGKALGKEIIAQVRGFVDSAIAPVLLRLKALEDAAPARDGKDADPAEIQRMVDEAVAKAVAALPRPENGKDGRDGADGVGLTGALIDRSGSLVLTFSNGDTKEIGVVVGRDGKDGRDGADGEQGPAGFDLDDFGVSQGDDGRTIELHFERGDLRVTRELELPVAIYRGVFKEGETYAIGDMVTWSGSVWSCTVPGTDKPGDGSKGWVLAVKKGRDGKDGKDGARGPEGKAGPAGRDLTQLGMDGAKW